MIKPNITNIIKRKQPKFIDFRNSPSFDFTAGLILRKGNPQFGQAARSRGFAIRAIKLTTASLQTY